MDDLKSFIYLDQYKLSSLASQVFQGVTEHLVSTSSTTETETENQKGPIGSGKLLADALKKESGTQEKKVLHDYLYSIFEKEIIEADRVFEVGVTGEPMENYTFIKVKAKATINDINTIKNILDTFNELGESFAYVTNAEALQQASEQLAEQRKTIKDRNKRSKIEREYKSATSIKKLAKDSGLSQDENFLKHLNYLLSYGYEDSLGLQMERGGELFTANLNRSHLRDSESMLIRKYSRITDKEFVIFGVISQGGASSEIEETDSQEADEDLPMKLHLMKLMDSLGELENHFTGRLSNEIMIDPIAVYMEL